MIDINSLIQVITIAVTFSYALIRLTNALVSGVKDLMSQIGGLLIKR